MSLKSWRDGERPVSMNGQRRRCVQNRRPPPKSYFGLQIYSTVSVALYRTFTVGPLASAAATRAEKLVSVLCCKRSKVRSLAPPCVLTAATRVVALEELRLVSTRVAEPGLPTRPPIQVSTTGF